MSDNTNTETADTTGWWIPLLAVVGMAAGGLSYATNTAALGLVGAVLLLIAAGAGMGQGWLVGLGPKQRGEAEDPEASEGAAEGGVTELRHVGNPHYG